MNYIKNVLCLTLLILGCHMTMQAQRHEVALKTNTLGWASVSPNIGMEIGLNRQATLDFYASINPFRFSNGKQWKHWLLMPEYRRWFCEKFYGHFLGVHLIGGEYNLGQIKLPFGVYSATRHARYEGWGVGAGLSYGYQWLLSRHWSIEGTLGVGYIYSEFEKYPCATCGTRLDSGSKHYFGVTKAAVNLIYMF